MAPRLAAVDDPEPAAPEDVADPDVVTAPEADDAVDPEPAEVGAAAEDSTELTPDGTDGADAVPPTLAQEPTARVAATIMAGSTGRSRPTARDRAARGRKGSVARSVLRRPCDMWPFCQPE